MLDIPDEVRNKVIADGNAAWLDELPSVVESLAKEWSLTIGATLRGGHAALVVEAMLPEGTAAVLKIGVPGTRRDLTFEATALRLADGDGCASLLRVDLDRGAVLLERLGAALYDVVPDPGARLRVRYRGQCRTMSRPRARWHRGTDRAGRTHRA